MKLTIYFDHRFVYKQDGQIGSPVHYNYELFAKRYLPQYQQVDIVTRTPLPAGEVIRFGDGVQLISVGCWSGAIDYFRKKVEVERVIKQSLQEPTATLMIVPGVIGSLAYKVLKSRQHPYGVEVVGDPAGSLAAKTMNHPLRPMLRFFGIRDLKRVCRDASCATYVTEKILQSQYPAPRARFQTHYSSIELAREEIASRPRQYRQGEIGNRLVCIGSMSMLYKAQDDLIKAVSHARQQGVSLQLKLIGDGKYRPHFESLVDQYELRGQVTFLGKIPPGEPIKQQLREADLCVLPSRTEGLPRTIIEAMAEGMACVATNVSGIPELLDQECLVPPNQPKILAEKILEMLSSPEMLTRSAARNHAKVHEYLNELLQPRRSEMYRNLRLMTEDFYGTSAELMAMKKVA